ncbi:MAG: sulfatase-like hydrolase/transferase, partial [Armatimonadetes bacterium]|nr:sulfatase-like hydrolase/transferase [Armatimonadota bacterium]NIN06125.1 sulfatase-like hydrolase/transferase [Armatimonadota bacterium]NIT31445.1 sulfatase-like hydrolase/transferase [Armatimonadota bacterium]
MSRKSLFLFAGVLLAGVLVAGWLWQPWHDAVMTVTVSVSTDEQNPAEVYKRAVTFSTSKGSKPLRTYIPLEEWEGELLRLDIRGKIKSRGDAKIAKSFVACSAQLIDTTGTVKPIEFVGWRNDGSLHFHPRSIGSLAFVAPKEGDSPYVYSENGLLWHVLRVPKQGTLRINFKSVMQNELKGDPKPSVPGARVEWRLRSNPSQTRTERPPDVFIYLIDALRADHLGCYGYSRPTSPNTDRFAREAVLYEQAHAASRWTRASVATLLTGLYPSAHSVMHKKTDKLAEWPVMLSEALKEAGYRTCSIVTNSHVTEAFGFDQGVDVFKSGNLRTPDWVNSRAAEFLAAQDRSHPVFVYLHTVEPHSPYAPEPETFRRFDRGFEGSCDGSVEALRKVGWIRPKLTTEDIQHLI